jgi:hypothetical protein
MNIYKLLFLKELDFQRIFRVLLSIKPLSRPSLKSKAKMPLRRSSETGKGRNRRSNSSNSRFWILAIVLCLVSITASILIYLNRRYPNLRLRRRLYHLLSEQRTYILTSPSESPLDYLGYSQSDSEEEIFSTVCYIICMQFVISTAG